MATKDIELIAHLLRRAGFGARRDELETYAARGYEATAEELLGSNRARDIEDDVLRRFHYELSNMQSPVSTPIYWLYRMASTNPPLQEKVALFWHGLFATGYDKVVNAKVLSEQIEMFRQRGMGSFKTLLVELSRNPAMIIWLDNNDNHNGSINENYGRELLELFSMGVGNYTEQDVKECSRAFTGWTLANHDYMVLKSLNDSIWPYGRNSWHYEYRPEDHDDGEKEFLGQRGRFNGEDIVDIICRQPATARFIARHMYHFFVADEPPVPQWPYTPPRDPEAIDVLAQAYFDSNYDVASVLRALFNSDFFKSESCWYEKVKSPAELVAGVLRLTGEIQRPGRDVPPRSLQMSFMGQFLTHPPSVEGWHQGTEWIDTGTLMERLNFASEQVGNLDNPGVKSIVGSVVADGDGAISPERLVDRSLDQLGALSVSEDTRRSLIEYTSHEGDLDSSAEPDEKAQQRVMDLLRMAVSTAEFQRS